MPAGEGFGARSPELVQIFSAATFDASADIRSQDYAPGDVVRMTRAPEGREFSGVHEAARRRPVVIDFNHPLAGMPMLFSVQVIGVL